MTVNRLAVEATTAALRLRATLGFHLQAPICPYDVARRLGVTVWFDAAPSLEGMYSPKEPSIVLGSLRPRGRRAFTCGHELGHHVLGHGLRIDHVADNEEIDGNDPAEYSADRFSGALLMPKVAVEHAFASRRWSAASCTPAQAYVVAGCLGVGYATLIFHMQSVLRIVSASQARVLQVPLPRLRKQILGFEPPRDLVVVDDLWRGRDVDLEVGDAALLPKGAVVDGAAVRVEAHAEGLLARAIAPGRGTARTVRWTAGICVSRREYRGLDTYRHMEDPDYDG
jgi:hypothetical protein